MVAQELHSCVAAAAFDDPARMPEFDRERRAGHPVVKARYIVKVRRAAGEIRRELKQQHPELACVPKRLQRAPEHLEGKAEHLGGRVLEAARGLLRGRKYLLDCDWKPRRVGHMLSEKRKRFHVED